MVNSLGESGYKASLTLCDQSMEINAFGAVTLTVLEGRHLMNVDESVWQCVEYVL